MRRFSREFGEFQAKSRLGAERLAVRWEDRLALLGDRTSATSFDRHYVYHTAWAARIVAETRPSEHVDISSSLYFSGIVSAFVPVKFYDYRPAALHLENLDCGSGDLTKLAFADRSIASLSCLHVIEHIGLGRYGDAMDPEGDLKALGELQRVLGVGGSLLLAIPVGRPRVCFNAHRVYSAGMIRGALAELRLERFWLLPDSDMAGSPGLIADAPEEMVARQDYGCGCFWFKRD
jgi:hypothetical protein